MFTYRFSCLIPFHFNYLWVKCSISNNEIEQNRSNNLDKKWRDLNLLLKSCTARAYNFLYWNFRRFFYKSTLSFSQIIVYICEIMHWGGFFSPPSPRNLKWWIRTKFEAEWCYFEYLGVDTLGDSLGALTADTPLALVDDDIPVKYTALICLQKS